MRLPLGVLSFVLYHACTISALPMDGSKNRVANHDVVDTVRRVVGGSYYDPDAAAMATSAATNVGTTANEWMARIYSNAVPKCGAVVLDRLHVITAAHCFYKPNPDFTNEDDIYMGDLNDELMNSLTKVKKSIVCLIMGLESERDV